MFNLFFLRFVAEFFSLVVLIQNVCQTVFETDRYIKKVQFKIAPPLAVGSRLPTGTAPSPAQSFNKTTI